MKVLHVYKEYHPVIGGIENHIKLLCHGLRERGEFEPTVLVTNQGAHTCREVIDGTPVIRAGRLATISRNPISLALAQEMALHPAQLIHLHFPHPTGELAYLLAGHNRKLVLTYHSDIVRQTTLLRLYAPFMRRVLAKANCILVTSEQYTQTSPHLSPYATKTEVVPLGIDLERFEGVDEAVVAKIRSRYAGPLLLFVGVLRYYKGLEYLLGAMERVQANLLIIGSGPLEGRLKQLVAQSGQGERVFFLGPIPDADLPAYYHASDIFVLPSSHRSEAYGLSQIEAMACGKPVICTELGTGTSFVNINELTGLVVPPANPTALADAINRLLRNSELRQKLGKQAQTRANNVFSADTMFDHIEQVYRQVME
jgi:glycosyltransferase involved in cell wall biosynthesis